MIISTWWLQTSSKLLES